MTRKIAIIKTIDYYGDYDQCDTLIQSITDWAEVSEEEYKMLYAAQNRLYYRILEQPLDTKKFVATTISEYKAMIAEEELQREKEKQKRAEVALAKKLKKDLKDKESKLELFQKLQKELGLDKEKV